MAAGFSLMIAISQSHIDSYDETWQTLRDKAATNFCRVLHDSRKVHGRDGLERFQINHGAAAPAGRQKSAKKTRIAPSFRARPTSVPADRRGLKGMVRSRVHSKGRSGSPKEEGEAECGSGSKQTMTSNEPIRGRPPLFGSARPHAAAPNALSGLENSWPAICRRD